MCRSAARVLSILLLLAFVPGRAAQDFRELGTQAAEAYRAGDFSRMQQRLESALQLRPGHPATRYNLACAQAMAGKTAAAVATLGSLAGQGLYYDLAAENDFNPLRALPSFAALQNRIVRNREPVGRVRRVFMVPNTTFIAEGIAFDRDTGSYFLGGVHARAIVRAKQGEVRPFAGGAVGGLLAPFGMLADSRRRLLWVVHAGVEEMTGASAADLGRSGLIAFDLDTGQVRRRALLPEDSAHQLGDLALAPDGKIYLSDAKGGSVFRFDSTRGTFESLLAPDSLVSAQGLVVSRDGGTLYVADYARGLFAIDLETSVLAQVLPSDDVHLFGIDGLSRHDDELIAIQNGYRPHRILGIRLDKTGRRVAKSRVLAAALPEFEQPTLGVVVGDGLSFVANSQWNRFDQHHQLPDRATMKNPLVLRVSLVGE